MSEQINIQDIVVFGFTFDKLGKLAKSMQEIKVINDLDYFTIYTDREITLGDKIVFDLKHYEKIDYDDHFYFFRNNEDSNLNCKLKYFKRANSISLNYPLHHIQILNNLNNNKIVIKELDISGETSDHLEQFTDPKYYRHNQIQSFKYLFLNEHEITDKTFTNLAEIAPKTVTFYDKIFNCVFKYNFL